MNGMSGEKNKIINSQINDQGDFIKRGSTIMNAEGVNINPDEITNKFESVKENAKNIGKNAFGLGKTVTNAVLKKQTGGSIKQFHNLSKKISSRILKSLKDFWKKNQRIVII